LSRKSLRESELKVRRRKGFLNSGTLSSLWKKKATNGATFRGRGSL